MSMWTDNRYKLGSPVRQHHYTAWGVAIVIAATVLVLLARAVSQWEVAGMVR